MTDYTIISKYPNKDACERLVKELEARSKSCYNFCAKPANLDCPTASPDEQMNALEQTQNFFQDPYIRKIFEVDLAGLKNAETVIILLPAGTSVHMEAGIAYGLGKRLILIGEPEKPETLYLIFEERYPTIEAFLEHLDSLVQR